jgi:hypothetical protein
MIEWMTMIAQNFRVKPSDVVFNGDLQGIVSVNVCLVQIELR